jgi:hypothetical protein
MKSTLLIGAAAGGVAIIGGVLAWQWMWVRTEAGRQEAVAKREARGRTN